MHLEINGEKISFKPGFKIALLRSDQNVPDNRIVLWYISIICQSDDCPMREVRFSCGDTRKMFFPSFCNDVPVEQMTQLFNMWVDMIACITGLSYRRIEAEHLGSKVVSQSEFISELTVDASEKDADATVLR